MQGDSKRYKKIGIHCILILLGLFCILGFLKVKYVNESTKAFSVRELITDTLHDSEYRFTPESGELTQTFQATAKILWGLELSFCGNWKNPQGTVQITVLDDKNQIVLEQTVAPEQVPRDKPYRMIFDHIETDALGREFQVKIKADPIGEQDVFKIIISEAEYSQGILQDAQKVQKGTVKLVQVDGQSQYLNKLFWGFALFLAAFIYLLYFLLFIKPVRIETIFLYVMTTAGILSLFLLKPGTVPDESAHFRSAYAWSNLVLGEQKEVYSPVIMREADLQIYETMGDTRLTANVYRNLKEQFLGKAGDSSAMVSIDKYPTRSPWYLYLGSAAGITVGRILGFNGLTVFYLGRIFNLLLFIGMVYYAMKKLPFYKMSIFAVCLFPMSVQLAGSYSYDPIILGLALIVAAQILAFIYEKDEKDKKFSLVKIIVSCALLGTCKGGAYIPLCALLLLIPQKHFTSKKKRLIFWGTLCSAIILAYLLTNVDVVSSSVGTSAHMVSWADEPGYTISWVMQHPGELIKLIANTLYSEGEYYVNSLIGKDLGWYNVPIQMPVLYGFMAVFLLSCIYVTTEKQAVILEPRQKGIVAVSIIASVGIIAAAMLLSWTPLSEDTIQGIQGRYFLPLLLPLVLCVKKQTLVLRRSIDRVLIFALGWLEILTVVDILVVPLKQLLR